MKCFYYLAPDLASTQSIARDLRELDVMEWFLHVISHDEAGLRREQIQSGNYLETTDLLRNGIIGGNIGLISAVVLMGLVMWLKPFGPDFPDFAYLLLLLFFTLFGAWVGGLIGLRQENRKIRRFTKEIEAGRYLVLLYVLKEQEAEVRRMMAERHGDAELVAVDRNFLNPFKRVQRPAAVGGGA